MRKFLALAVPGAVVSLGALAAYRVASPWYRSWGKEPGEAERLLPGDEVIAMPFGSETRAISIDAPAAAIWPWLVQMGFGRGGWYSYDAMDMRDKSADHIVPEWQAIAVGDIIPTHPAGGFEVVQVEPDHALVLYFDDEMIERQAAAAVPDAERMPAGLAVSGAILGSQPTKFRVTWAFVLEPVSGTQTRLIERCRVEYAESTPMSRVASHFVGFGVFVMIRRQLLGLKGRAERLVHETPVTETPEGPAVTGIEEAVVPV
jgi:hypothetical protein